MNPVRAILSVLIKYKCVRLLFSHFALSMQEADVSKILADQTITIGIIIQYDLQTAMEIYRLL
jgi:hypothetical protein